jgi:hypothetical protein
LGQNQGVTYLGKAVEQLNRKQKCDRLIVITDDRDTIRYLRPRAKGI